MQILNTFELINVAGGGDCLCFYNKSIYARKYDTKNDEDAPGCAIHCCTERQDRWASWDSCKDEGAVVLWTWFGKNHVIKGDCCSGSVSVMS